MTSLTIHLPDDLVERAKYAGLLDQQLLADTLTNFLNEKIQQQAKVGYWTDFFNTIDQCTVPNDFLVDREQPEIQDRQSLVDLFADTQ